MAAPSMSMTLTSLLNSLHTQLQSQTQLLPTLHAQLGLPPTALEEELRTLQKQLIRTVEAQITLRQKEVEQWMERCENVEAECLCYSKALGPNTKVTETSVGELRKERVLPRRFELVSEHQEKLRQVYHTKLEQLATLTNRIKALSRTLGTDYFTQDILELIVATRENSTNVNAKSDVTTERFSKLEKELVRGKAEVTKRLNQLSATFVQIDWLYTELGIVPPAPDDLPSSSQSYNANFLSTSHSALQRPSSSGSSPRDLFLVSTPSPLDRTRPTSPLLFQETTSPPLQSDYKRIFANFVVRLELAEDEGIPANPSTPIGLENVEPTYELLSWATNLRSLLEETKRKREAHIQAMYDQLEGLWKRLGVGEVDMDAFVEAHRGSTEETVREYEEELERMLELKRERMGQFIESAREEIIRLWDDLMVGEEERADFAPFADDEHTEELLNIHEDEIRRLKEERRQKSSLLASIKKYFDICGEEQELAAAASDQTRLTGRGRDPGRLLREEKMRKRVQKEKPRLESDLLISIPAWENENKKPFLVHGESILQILMEAVSAQDQENKRKPARAGSVPPRATTPVNSSNGYVPGARTGMVTPAVRPGTTSQSVPNKRQKLVDSAPSLPLQGRQGSGGKGHGPQSRVRVPLGLSRGGNEGPRAVSPSKIPAKVTGGQSSLPRPPLVPVPKPGTQHHALGHGRLPSGLSGYTSGARSTSGMTSGGYGSRYLSGGSSYGALDVVKKATRARRESFKPRPSMDAMDIGVGQRGKWPGLVESLKEEEEG